MILEKHRQEWLDSCVSPEIIEANVESFSADDHSNPYHPAIERLLGPALAQIGGHGDQYATRPVQQLIDRYRHVEGGGWWVSGCDPLNNWEPMEWGQFKPEAPRDNPEKSGKVIKYEACPKTPTRAFFLQGGVEWAAVLKETTHPILITEGAKKAGCALTLGYAAIALPGVRSGYRSKDLPEPQLIPDLKIWATSNRPIYLAFDQDSKSQTKHDVNHAIAKFGQLLVNCGADVRIVAWKPQDGKGLDDLVKNCGNKKLKRAIHNAQPFDTWHSKLRSQRQDSVSDDQPKANRLKKSYHAVETLWGECLAFNEYTKEIELNGEPIEIGKAKLRLAVDHNLLIGTENLELILMDLAERNAYHPVRNYLENCGQKNTHPGILDSLSQRYFGTTEPIYDAYLKRTLIGTVARVFEPGCKFDNALILQGSQGVGKSTFFKILAGGDDYFDDSLGAASDKDERLKLHQSWILEWAELESVFKRKDIAQTKAFITSSVDNVRPPYGRQAVRMARQSIIVGSTNQDEFLSDATGNRRFWVIPVQGAIDLELLRSERDQIWADAVAAYQAGEKLFLSPEERTQAAEAIKDYQTSDPWQTRIETYLSEGHHNEVTTGEILTNALKIEIAQQGRREQMRVADMLRTMGWLRKKITRLGKRCWGYVKPEPLPEQEEFKSKTESCDRNSTESPVENTSALTETQLIEFMNWNLDQPERYQSELTKLPPRQVDYLYKRLPELKPLTEQQCLETTT